MNVTSEWIPMDDHVEIYIKKWGLVDITPRAILQLAHGMAEHIERYDEFARFLIQNGIVVVGNDHRGHGHTGERAGNFGYFADENGFERVVDDLYEINQRITKEYPNVPIFLMGHSMGSFLSRRYIQKYANTIKGVILSGTGGSSGLAGKVGKLIAKREMRKNGPKMPSPLLNRLSFGQFNKGIDSPKSEFDWLTRESVEVEKYINDPFCGFVCSSSFFYDLLTGLEKIHEENAIQWIPKDLPMFIFSGENDPVGGKTKAVLKVIDQYKRNGIRNIESLFFKEGRHEMLNESNKQDVYEAVYKWITKQLGGK
jgi:alpha-beta hydrolase superfamily lysophospholipase